MNSLNDNSVMNNIVVGSINIHVPKACNDISLRGFFQWNFSHLLMCPFQVLFKIVLKDLDNSIGRMSAHLVVFLFASYGHLLALNLLNEHGRPWNVVE